MIKDIYRHRRNRNRVYALQYTGDNERALEIFTGHRVFKFKDSTTVRCNNCDIKKDEWVVRKIIEIDEFRKKISETFIIMDSRVFKKTYKQRKIDDSREYNN